MKRRNLSSMLLPLLTIGCMEQQDQVLPFESGSSEVTRTVPMGGGIISTPVGASVRFPAQAFASDQSVSLSVGSVTASMAASGRVISAHSFALAPAGMLLGAAAEAGLRFQSSAGDSAWLASVISHGSAGVTEHADTRVDVASGIATAPLRSLATLAVVIPRADAILPLGPTGPSPVAGTPSPAAVLRLLQADSATVRCGGPGRRCQGLTITASESLLRRVGRAAAVFPVLDGHLSLRDGELTGTVSVSTAIRAELAGGQTAENVRIHEDFQFRVRLPSVPTLPGFSASRSAARGEETITLHVPETGSPVATVRYGIQVPNAAGAMEPATVSISFPLQLHHR